MPKLAQTIGLPQQTIYSALRNGLVGASVATVMPIAAALRIDPFQLTRNKVVPLPDGERGYTDVPLYGNISAGSPSEAVVTKQTFPIPSELAERYRRAFLLVVTGESMNRVLPNGCYALIDPVLQSEITEDIYAVRVGASDATVKRVKPLDNGVVLEPDSTDPTFRPRVFDFADDDDEQVVVIGRVVWFCPPLDWTREQ